MYLPTQGALLRLITIGLTFVSITVFSTVMANVDVKRDPASSAINYNREDKGTPIADAERRQATDNLIQIFKGTGYFDFVDSHTHGIPENDPTSSYWWGTWWSGITVTKLNGQVTYTHSEDGSDNAGIQTAPYLEGACFAYLLTGDKKYEHLARKLMRGMSSWILSSSKSEEDAPSILSRAFYPESRASTDGGRDIYINYQASRPGKNSKASGYVHIPNNPIFGDVWVKHKRSTDDIGHMLRAMVQTQSCRDAFSSDARADLDHMTSLYANWARGVDSNKFNIPTYDLNAEIISVKNAWGDYNAYKVVGLDPTCIEKLAIRYMHQPDAGNLKCGNGISVLEKMFGRLLQNDAIEILRSHHLAAAGLAQFNSSSTAAEKLLKGLEHRMNRDFHIANNPTIAAKYDIQDIASFMIHSNNVGLPLTSDEIRYLYGRIDIAHTGMLDPVNYNKLHLFDSSVPNGTYSFDPPHNGIYFYALGVMIGSCTSTFKNSNNIRPLLDCERLKNGLLAI